MHGFWLGFPNAFHNKTDRPSRFLSVSVHYHEVLLDEAGTEVGIDDPMPAEPDPAEMARFGGISARLQGYWVEPGANGGPRDARTPGEPADPTIEYGSGKGPV